MMPRYYFIAVIIFLTLFVENAFATEPILITISNNMDQVIFDGKWTHTTEWKRSGLNTLTYDDGTVVQLRTAHQGDFIYVFVDAVSDTYLDNGVDKTTVCLDTMNDKSETANADDYCFAVTLDEKDPSTLQGGSLESDHFNKIANHVDFIGISSVSDENDRYTNVPHPSYEFRIPTDLVGRSDIYGFYLGVYDGHSGKIYSWPQEIILDSSLQIPSPSNWSDIVSPDKSLPEFGLPMITILVAISFSVYLTKFRYR